jgi:hypothetical protein
MQKCCVVLRMMVNGQIISHSAYLILHIITGLVSTIEKKGNNGGNLMGQRLRVKMVCDRNKSHYIIYLCVLNGRCKFIRKRMLFILLIALIKFIFSCLCDCLDDRFRFALFLYLHYLVIVVCCANVIQYK